MLPAGIPKYPYTSVTAVLLLLLLLLGLQGDLGLLVPEGSQVRLQDAGSQPVEHLVDVGAVAGGGLHEVDLVLLRQFLALLRADLPVWLHVGLGGHQDQLHVEVARLADLVDPVLYVLVAGRVHDRVGQHDAMGALVEGFGYVPEPLLAGRVPYVQGHLLALVLDSLDLEVHADGAQVVVMEGVLAVPAQQIGLADPAVADDYVLERDALGFGHTLRSEPI